MEWQSCEDLSHLFAYGSHTWREKCFRQLTLARQCEFVKTFEPLTGWHVELGFQPVLQLGEIVNGDPAFPEPLDQVTQNTRRRRLPDLRHSRIVCGKLPVLFDGTVHGSRRDRRTS